ncbi:hypothetical protein D3C87_1484130 [compost metagenome]
MGLMTWNFIFRYIAILMVGLLAGNSFAFVLGMGPAMESLTAMTYLEFHRQLEGFFSGRTPIMYAVAIASLILDLILQKRTWKSLEFVLVLFALICILDELLMALGGSAPITHSLRDWSVQNIPVDWVEVRDLWLRFMYWRSAMLVSSFALLLAATCLTSKSLEPSEGVAVVA